MNKLASSCSFVSLVVAFGLIGCGGGGGEESIDSATQALATDGVEAVNSSDQATDSLTDATFEAVPSADVMMAADSVATAPDEAVDGKCRTRAKDPNDPSKVIITLNNCKTRFGRHSASGTIIVQFSQGADANTLQAVFTSQGLTIDGKPATHSATADIMIDGMTRHIEWNGGFDTVSDSGEAISHTSALTIHVDKATKCRTRNGTGQTTVGDRQMSTTFTDFQVCRNDMGVRMCPTGNVSHTRGDKTISVAFDGSNVAVVTTPKNTTFEKTLLCGN